MSVCNPPLQRGGRREEERGGEGRGRGGEGEGKGRGGYPLLYTEHCTLYVWDTQHVYVWVAADWKLAFPE